jgi:hypothetical protein
MNIMIDLHCVVSLLAHFTSLEQKSERREDVELQIKKYKATNARFDLLQIDQSKVSLKVWNDMHSQISSLMDQGNIKVFKASRDISVRIVEHTPVGIDKNAIGLGDTLPQSRCRRVVREVSGTVLERESFVRSASMSVSTHIVLVQQLWFLTHEPVVLCLQQRCSGRRS